MVINISVQYNGGFLPDIILLTQSLLEYYQVCSVLSNTIPDGMLYCLCFCFFCTLLSDIILLTQCCVLLPDSIRLTQCFAIEEPV